MTDCTVCDDVGPYPIFVENSEGDHVLEHRCADHLPEGDDE